MIPAFIAAWKMKKDKKEKEMPSGSGADQGGVHWIKTGGGRDSSGSPYVYQNGQLVPAKQAPYGGGRDAGTFYIPENTPIQAKGGGGGGPRPPSPMEQAQATLFLEQERNKIAAQQKAAADATALAEKNALRTTATGKQNAAYGAAQSYGSNTLANKGYNAGLLDKYNVYDQYMSDINTQKQGWDEFDVTPDLNTNSALQNAINTGQTTYRGDVTKGINTATGQGFETQLIGDTMDDAILNTILGKQNTSAKESIEAAHQRGILNDVGYAKALSELGTANTAGMGQLQSIGGGVLGGYRTGLTNAKNQALTTAGGLTLADLYDLGAYQTGITGQVNKAKAGLEGDIYGAVGDQQFFDPNKIIAGAGAGQGFYNPAQATAPTGATGNPLLEQMTEEEKRRTSPTSQVF